jgi:preprotein translocase subunit SecB
MSDKTNEAGASADDSPQIGLQKVYLKDASYEAPNSPAIFSGEWKPSINLNLATRHTNLGNNTYEVVLEATVEAKQDDSIAFLAEIQQAGIFLIRGFDEEELSKVLATFCPTQIYPYARESIADLVGKGGFPQLHLQPVSFEAMAAGAEADGEADGEADEKAETNTETADEQESSS